jgi:hypothetical protein
VSTRTKPSSNQLVIFASMGVMIIGYTNGAMQPLVQFSGQTHVGHARSDGAGA